jgi:hypothetical protein
MIKFLIRMKKVAFIGSHGTRKTTHSHGLVFYLKEKGINSDLLYEVARRSPLPINEGRTQSAQRWILHTQIAEELAYEKQHLEFLVCDRSSLDNYAYYVEKFGRDKVLDSLVKNHIKTYDILIKVPIVDREIIEDGIRSTDKSFQKNIDLTVDNLLKDFGADYINFKDMNQIKKYVLENYSA